MSPGDVVLRVDPTRCVGYGACAGILPDWITTDDWGYPIIDSRPLPAALLPYAARAVHMCPGMALRLEGSSSRLRAM